MPRRNEIFGVVSTDLFHLQIFNSFFNYNNLDPAEEFERWAAVEVFDFHSIPAGMESYLLRGGLYAVFFHKGLASEFQQTFDRIYRHWLPSSPYALDRREHFELLGEKYKNNHPDSEEEIWVPIKERH